MSISQAEIDQRNVEFWDTLCGTVLAQSLGINDRSPESLRKFDQWFFDYYPYLDRHIPYAAMKGKDVVEIGLGYGSVAQKIAAAGAVYRGLDIAPGPVEMVDYRMWLQGLNGEAVQGSVLDAPFEDASFDYVVSIGCFHHTGNMPRAIDEAYRILRPGGRFVLMVYNALSYRRWYGSFETTLRYCLGVEVLTADAAARGEYDTNPSGDAAPHTDFVSRGHLRRMCRQFRAFSARLENIASEPPLTRWSRTRLLKTPLPRFLGLDIYATAIK
jgi:SAM-dependent methyltransferase